MLKKSLKIKTQICPSSESKTDYLGQVEHILEDRFVRGWCVRCKNAARPVRLSFFLAGQVIGAVNADSPWPDLCNVLGFEGNFGFEFDLREAKFDFSKLTEEPTDNEILYIRADSTNNYLFSEQVRVAVSSFQAFHLNRRGVLISSRFPDDATASKYIGHIDSFVAGVLKGWVVSSETSEEMLRLSLWANSTFLTSDFERYARDDPSGIAGNKNTAGFSISLGSFSMRKKLLRFLEEESEHGYVCLSVRVQEDKERYYYMNSPIINLTKSELAKNLTDEHQPENEESQPKTSGELTLREEFPGQQVGDALIQSSGVKLIAYYLPQFHPIPENDEWWGKGFTEWASVSTAKPQYDGHNQPQLPSELGYYDLRLPEVREEQAKLAREYGVYGFCYYYYWFAGRKLLERPLTEVFESGSPDFPFCICWANESWTRNWDGADREVLQAQTHCLENDTKFIYDVLPILKDPRYIRVNDAPLLLVYRPLLIPDIGQVMDAWRKICAQNGLKEIHLCAVESFGFNEPQKCGFNSAAEFPPHGLCVPTITNEVPGLEEDFEGTIYSYEEVIGVALARKIPYPCFRGLMTSWDNTARRGKSANIFDGSTPKLYEIWLRGLIDYTRKHARAGEEIIFINAWNEWAEGTHLEPDRKHGRGYLEATRRSLADNSNWREYLESIRKRKHLDDNELSLALDSIEVRFERLEKSLSLLTRKLASTFPTTATLFAEYIPSDLSSAETGGKSVREGPGGCVIERINHVNAQNKGAVSILADKPAFVMGWSYCEGVALAQDSISYLALQSVQDEEKRYYAPLYARIRRQDVADCFPARSALETMWAGFEATADFGKVSPGKYVMSVAYPAEKGGLIVKSEREVIVVQPHASEDD